MTDNEQITRFKQIMQEIKTLAKEAGSLLPPDSFIDRRAEAYWLNTITGCVDGRATMTTMRDTLEELREFYYDGTE